MKHLSLQQAMLGMRVIQTDTGTIIKSPAGSAVYDLKGRRIKVSGYPEYFPDHLRVKDKRKPKHGSTLINDEGITCRSADGTVSVRIELFEEPKARPDMPGKEFIDRLQGMQEAIADSLDDVKELCIGAYDLPEGKTPVIFLLDRYTAIGGSYTPTEIEKAVEHIKDIRLQADLSKSMAAVSPFVVDKGKVFINSAVIGDGVSTAIRGVKLNADESGTQHAAGMSVGVRPEQVAFHAAEDDGLKRARIADVVSRYLTGEYAEYQQEMADELIAVFDSCLASNENGRHSVDNLQQTMQQAATDAIRNALKPGGLLYNLR